MGVNEPTKTKTPIPSFPTLKARGERVTMITVYDYPFARLVDSTSAELKYTALAPEIAKAYQSFTDDVRSGAYPKREQCFLGGREIRTLYLPE